MRHRRSRVRAWARDGAVLLEVIVALTTLVIAGVSITVTISESASAIQRVRAADRETRAANAFLNVVSLWTREDLDRHLGTRPQGPWRLRIEHPSSSLYDAVLEDTLTGRLLLSTSLYRRDDRAKPQP